MELDLNTTTAVIMALGVLTPFVTAVLTKLRDPNWWKGVVSLTTAIAIGAFAEIQGAGLDAAQVSDIVANSLVVWGFHLMTFFGLTEDMVAKVARLPQVMRFSLPSPKGS